ncbi:hypothetical protein B0H16DRAFT_1548660 [Mycena metata]|uniref:Uncharacterized protein n=1 Tax=Mycena metata TaxID=1033252 RepID=A0AAD7NA38_9AGAR|nr:hypothetical protein B0H16DRAFT_1548660 [Mycena metata]
MGDTSPSTNDDKASRAHRHIAHACTRHRRLHPHRHQDRARHHKHRGLLGLSPTPLGTTKTRSSLTRVPSSLPVMSQTGPHIVSRCRRQCRPVTRCPNASPTHGTHDKRACPGGTMSTTLPIVRSLVHGHAHAQNTPCSRFPADDHVRHDGADTHIRGLHHFHVCPKIGNASSCAESSHRPHIHDESIATCVRPHKETQTQTPRMQSSRTTSHHQRSPDADIDIGTSR